jgi:hypothetical protein
LCNDVQPHAVDTPRRRRCLPTDASLDPASGASLT